MSESLHPGGLSGWPLGCVGAPQLGPEVEGLRRLSRQRFELTHARNDANRHTAGIHQIDREPADRLGQGARRRTVGVGQPPDVSLVRGDECGTDESRRWPAADQHTRRARIAATQLQLVAAARHGGEAERMRKRLGANQIRLLEFQPREIVDLDHRVRRPAAVLSFSCTLLAVRPRRHCRPSSEISRSALSYNAQACSSKSASRSTASPPISLAMNNPSAPAMAYVAS